MNGQPTTPLFGRSRGRNKRDWSDELKYPDPSVVLGSAVVDGIAAGCAVLQQLSDAAPVPDPEEIDRAGLGSPLDRLRTFLILQEALKDPKVQELSHARGSLPPSLRDNGRFSRMKETVIGAVVKSAVDKALEAASDGNNLKQEPPIPGHIFNVPEKKTYLPFDPWLGVVGEPVRSAESEDDSATLAA
jgi:hypothetical protein